MISGVLDGKSENISMEHENYQYQEEMPKSVEHEQSDGAIVIENTEDEQSNNQISKQLNFFNNPRLIQNKSIEQIQTIDAKVKQNNYGLNFQLF